MIGSRAASHRGRVQVAAISLRSAVARRSIRCMKTATGARVRAVHDVPLYEADFFEWTQRTADQLRRRRFDEVDIAHAAEEIEDMGKRDLRELNSRMEVLLAHLLKGKLQPRKRSKSWRATIVVQRREIAALLEDSPSLRPRVLAATPGNYAGAVARAAAETGIGSKKFPLSCPFSNEAILDPGFLPD
jgi:hypothetical protein